ncbi:valine--pyruvate transaminase [Marinimicrobium sp. ABcell2]|uniref:valine--pyruvate transaminase n=1 Tax=Marinimicrobium sp. ABcell2 TaxID=3069751 RepID=UPI0027B2889C|nr:valine--pyruvate transaminase [Marinimicrobium sp. ABcell2]MDQ2075270.1 valine--pyruvate transaminase [Marinimicrobium sp. ABcell2]
MVRLSRFGEKITAEAGIVTLMEDLGDALRVNPDMIFMGGGNPAAIPAVEIALHAALQGALEDPLLRQQMLGVYQPPQGEAGLLDDLASLLSREYGWPLTRDNIALANGSQSAFFVLFNLFGGEAGDAGGTRHIQLPLAPEYLGYADLGLAPNLFRAARPSIEMLPDRLFKYRVNFDQLQIDESTGALCLSRPTNPTGNVLTDDEMARLDQLARAQEVPLIVDGAYGLPFPNIVFEAVRPHWNDNTILVLSLSKLGLPGARTGLVIARPEIIQAFTRANTVLNLASGNFGPAIARQLLANGQLLGLSREVVQPFYRMRMEQALNIFQRHLEGLPCFIHKPEGAIFLWLWFKGLPIPCQQLYETLKERGVLVVPGHHFFLGLEDEWAHSHECIRVTYCQDPARIEQGAKILAEEVRKLYA